MERSLFFNSSQGDVRTYQASDFAWYFDNILKPGLIHTDGVPELEVKCEGDDLRTYVVPGRAIIHGYAYENTSDLYLEHALPEATQDRIDRIVLRLDKRNQSRFIKLFVLQGEPSSHPVAPSLQRDEFIYELSLAQIRVRANTSALDSDDLLDQRLDESLCGLVSIQDTGFARLGDFQDHVSDEDNPHNVTASQIGAIPLGQKGTANGVATLDSGGDVSVGQLGNAFTSPSDVFVTGTYTGNAENEDSTTYREVSLGFRPSAVLIWRTEDANYMDNYFGFGVYPNGLELSSGRKLISISSNGFRAYNYDGIDSIRSAYLNVIGSKYNYIAFK